MTFSKFVSLLQTQALYFSIVALLPDAGEGRLPLRNLREWNEYIVLGMEHNRNTTAVNCWHMRPGESWSMWGAYCGLSDGIAIRATYARLTGSFRSVEGSMTNEQTVAIGLVQYMNFDSAVIDTPNGYIPLMRKRREFEDEREVRAMLWPDPFLKSAFEQSALAGCTCL